MIRFRGGVILFLASLAVLPSVLPGVLPGPAAAGVMDHVTFEGSSSGVLPSRPDETLELHIDEKVDVTWDEEGFLVDLAAREGVVARGEPLLARIDALKRAVGAFLAAQEGLVALREVAIRLDRAGSADDSALVRAELETVADRYADKGLDAFGTIEELDADLYAELEEPLNTAVLAEDYLALADVLERKLRELSDELASRVEAGLRVEVTMRAKLVSRSGSSTPVHLDGYDNAAVGEPRPFPRNQTAVDERTMRELKAADGIAGLVRDVVDGTFSREIERSIAQLQTSLRELRDEVRAGVLEAQLDALIEDLEDAGDATLGPLIEEVRGVRNLIVSLSEVPELSAATDAGRLVDVHGLILSAGRRLRTVAERLPNALVELSAEAEELSRTRAGLIGDQTLAALEEAKETFQKKQKYLMGLYARVEQIRNALGVTQGVVDEAERMPKRIAPGVSLDTYLELQTTPAERHPGDELILRVDVETEPDGGPTAPPGIVAHGQQTFRLEFYGLYSETRGAVILVDPRSPISRDLDFQPVPALVVQWRVGIKHAPAWNRTFAPGFGISFSILDFEDQRDFELGIAANFSFFADLLHAGYGRNLQAKADFAYVGLNPLTVGGMVRRGVR